MPGADSSLAKNQWAAEQFLRPSEAARFRNNYGISRTPCRTRRISWPHLGEGVRQTLSHLRVAHKELSSVSKESGAVQALHECRLTLPPIPCPAASAASSSYRRADTATAPATARTCASAGKENAPESSSRSAERDPSSHCTVYRSALPEALTRWK